VDVPILYLIRHGRTELNQNNCFRGSVDVPLSSEGTKDSEEAAEFLKTLDAEPVFIVTSDKKRAVQTADILAKNFDAPVKESHYLRALNVGKFSGQPRSKENVTELQKYIDNPDTPIPQGESLSDFQSRVVPVLEECFGLACNNGLGFVVCHSSIIHEVGTQLFNDHTSLVVEPGGVVVIGIENGKPSAKSIFKKHKPAGNTASIS
jgi:broad specificity phosphatase PhoE